MCCPLIQNGAEVVYQKLSYSLQDGGGYTGEKDRAGGENTKISKTRYLVFL